MPTYEFRCPTGHDFEKFYRSIGSAPSVVDCPHCGKTAARQMSAGGGLVFKGSGFYITDYGKDGKKSQTPPVKAGETSPEKVAGEGGATKVDSRAAEVGAGADKPVTESKSAGESKTTTPPAAKKSKNKE